MYLGQIRGRETERVKKSCFPGNVFYFFEIPFHVFQESIYSREVSKGRPREKKLKICWINKTRSWKEKCCYWKSRFCLFTFVLKHLPHRLEPMPHVWYIHMYNFTSIHFNKTVHAAVWSTVDLQKSHNYYYEATNNFVEIYSTVS